MKPSTSSSSSNIEVDKLEQEYEELRQYHNKCCEENVKKEAEGLEKYNQVSRDFYNGKYCNKENCSLLKAKEQECERFKKDLLQNFEEKDKLHLIIDRLLEASGYNTNTASAEDFEDVYENMRYEKQQLDQLKAENEDLKIYIESNEQQVKEVETLVMDNDRLINELDKLKQTLTEIKDIACDGYNNGQTSYATFQCEKIIDIINEVE